ncbi:MAG: hypothetical protein MRZ79_13080 [Bacteroidia bacterium]|nr:hypothetical protein [Bacteroidia bacterium]
MKKSPLELEKHRLERYRNFALLYKLPEEKFEQFVALYEISELEAFMTPEPTLKERQIFSELIGVQGVAGYMDYIKSNNTFELIMQWQEQTGNFGNSIFFNQDSPKGK